MYGICFMSEAVYVGNVFHVAVYIWDATPFVRPPPSYLHLLLGIWSDV